MTESGPNIYLVETPDLEADIASEGDMALIRAQKPLIYDPNVRSVGAVDEATIIRNAISITGIEGGAAKTIGDFYEFGEVGRGSFLDLKKLIEDESTHSEEICEQILKLIEEGLLPEDFLGNYIKAESKFSWRDTTIVNRDGLISTIDSYGDLVPTVESVGEMCDDKSYAFQIAIVLGMVVCATQTELVFVKDPDPDMGEFVLHPTLASDREHLSLGRFDSEGVFIPVLTVLNKEHPAVTN
jgi:hypothetical protein